MSKQPINGARAVRLARGAQIAAGSLVLAAVGLAVGVPQLGDRPIPRPQVAAPVAVAAATPSADGVEPVAIDTPIVLAERLEMGRKKEAKKPDPEPQTTTTTIVQQPPEPSDWKFLGMIREPGRTLALVSVDGTQAFVPVGSAIGDDELVDVTSKEITLRKGGVERKVPRAEKTSSSVAWVKMPTNAPPTPAAPAGIQPGVAPGGPGGPLSPEMIQRMRERGIDPAQAQKMREFFRDQRGGGRNRGQPGGNQGGNGGGGRGGNEPFLDRRPGFDPGSGGRGDGEPR